MPTWMVIGLGIWISISLFVVAICVAARRIDDGLSRRAGLAFEPIRAESPAGPPARVE